MEVTWYFSYANLVVLNLIMVVMLIYLCMLNLICECISKFIKGSTKIGLRPKGDIQLRSTLWKVVCLQITLGNLDHGPKGEV